MAEQTEPLSLGQMLRIARSLLAEAGVDNPALDARLLVEHFSATSRADAITSPGLLLDGQTAAAISAALERRVAGESVHRIMGFREFHGLRLRLSSETLEPRPDTESLVDAVLPFVRETAARLGSCRLLDLGTGTGAIALAILKEVPGAIATGTDVSADALATAVRNAEEVGLGPRFTAIQSDWYSATEGRYHLILSNPPYIARKEIETLQPEVRKFDPVRALDGGEDGLDCYRIIANGAGGHLEPGARISVEIGYNQRADVEQIFGQAGYGLIAVGKDLAKHPRALVFQRQDEIPQEKKRLATDGNVDRVG
jgi:release factor glutamine methyltransferase